MDDSEFRGRSASALVECFEMSVKESGSDPVYVAAAAIVLLTKAMANLDESERFGMCIMSMKAIMEEMGEPDVKAND